MGSPYDMKYTVPTGTGEFCYRGKKYSDGDVVSMKREDFLACQKTQMPEELDTKCFPEYCEGSEGYPTDGYRVPVTVLAGGVVAIEAVPSIEGCKPPNTVCFHYCAPCLYVEYDADPIYDAADPNAANGAGADPNPTCRNLIKNGVSVKTIHMANPSDVNITVTLSYYC